MRMSRRNVPKMSDSASARTAVGIDVGGPKKGFHAVALEGSHVRGQLVSSEEQEIVHWCTHTMDAAVIAVDAPSRWAARGESRAAERQLMQQRISCFSAPTRAQALAHPTGYFDWMLRGEALYRALRPTHPICEQWPPLSDRYCFETFPHAITWHLRGGNADAKLKRPQRRQLLAQRQIALDTLTNIDLVDAALCAVAAQAAVRGEQLVSFGDARTGLILVPASP